MMAKRRDVDIASLKDQVNKFKTRMNKFKKIKKPTDNGGKGKGKFRFAEQSVSITTKKIPGAKELEEFQKSVCKQASDLVALLKKETKRSEQMSSLLCAINSISSSSE